MLGVAAALTLTLGSGNGSQPSSSSQPSPTPAATSTLPVSAPTLEQPTGAVSAGSFDLSGSGTAGSTIQILQDDKVLGKTQVSADGGFSYPLALEEGTTKLRAETLDSSGKSVAQSEVLTLEVAAATPEVIPGDVSTAKPDPIPKPVPIPEPVPTPEPTEVPAAPTFAILSPKDGSSVGEGKFTLSGVAAPDSTVDVFDGDIKAGTVKSDEVGQWSLAVTPTTPGDHAYEIRGGAETSRISVSVRPKGLAAGSLVPCPCNLRVTTLPADAVVTVFEGNRELERQRGPNTFFEGYGEGNYRYNVYVKGYKSLDKNFSLPKNRNISVYLDKNRP